MRCSRENQQRDGTGTQHFSQCCECQTPANLQALENLQKISSGKLLRKDGKTSRGAYKPLSLSSAHNHRKRLVPPCALLSRTIMKPCDPPEQLPHCARLTMQLSLHRSRHRHTVTHRLHQPGKCHRADTEISRHALASGAYLARISRISSSGRMVPSKRGLPNVRLCRFSLTWSNPVTKLLKSLNSDVSKYVMKSQSSRPLE